MKESPKAMDKTDNEIIAGFMGVKEQQGFYDSYGQDEPFWYTANEHFRTHSRSIPDLSFVEFIEHCKYHTSWDWLMPVVEKIESLPEGYDVDIRGVNCMISQGTPQGDGGKFFEVLFDVDEFPKIQATYKAVVQFIKFYNSQNNGQ